MLVGAILGIGLCLPQSSQAQVTLSGTVYSDAGVTAQAVSKTIKVAVGTSTPGVFSTTSVVTTGAWTVTIPAGHGISTSTPILVWIDGDVTTRGQVLTKASTSAAMASITGLDIYKNRVIARHETQSGTSTTLADFSFYTSAQDSDIQHSTSTGLLTIASGNELYIWTGDTFAPGSAVTVSGNASATSTDGSMYLASTSIYNAGGNLTLGGSLRAASTATFNGGSFSTFFNATTTGKIINAPISSIGNVTFSGNGGGWTFTDAATTSAFTILAGTVTAPATTLGVTGTFQNDATFVHNSGTMVMAGAATVALGDIMRYSAGRDASGNAAGTQNVQVSTLAVSGNYLYLGKAGNATACSQTAGSAQGCELLVFDVGSTTNPVYVAGRDASGSAAGTGNLAINNILPFGNYLYVGKATNGTACSQTAGSAIGCEFMVFDIASGTNPVYVAGRDSSGSAAGTDATTGITNLATSTNTVYVSKTGSATACSQTAGSAAGCELLVFNVSSTTNPIYAAGRDVLGTAAGTGNLAINQIMTLGQQLYITKAGNPTACSQTPGASIGCELVVLDISSTTNPNFIAGRDVTGSAIGTGNLGVTGLYVASDKVYIGKAGGATVCSQTAGSAIGCELMVFDVSSTTNPVYVRGIDVAGSYSGAQTSAINNIFVKDNYLYAVESASAIPCSQFVNLSLGCELLVFDISSSTAVRMLAGRDAGGDSTGVQSLGITAVVSAGNNLYVAKAGNATACSQTAGSAIGCELMVFDISVAASGVMMGALEATSSLNHVVTSGLVEFRNNAQIGNLSISSGTTTAPALLTVGGNFQNDAVFLDTEGVVIFSSPTAQTIGGNLTASSQFYKIIIAGSGTTTFSSNASTTFLEIKSGAVLEMPNVITVSDTLKNNGVFKHNSGTLETQGFLNEFLSGISAGGSMSDIQGLAFNAFAQKNSILYAVKAGSVTACSQTAGSAVGCELMVFDISSTTNPVYVAGRDASGSAAGTGNLAATQLAVVGNFLYITKAANATACSQTAGSAIGCELMVFDISSTTNPIYVAGRDASGSAAGTANIGVNNVVAANGVLYVVKGGDATACSQTAGSAIGCELMAFNIASGTNPIYVAGRDAGGDNTGTQTLNTPGVALSGTSLYIAKAGSATACSQTAGSAIGCELMVFNISSTTNPIYVAGRDGTGSAAGAVSNAIQFITTNGTLLHVAKAGSATACSQTAGSATGCEYMVFDISSTTNPIYIAGRDTSGSAAGTENLAATMITATGTQIYFTKVGNNTACSQTAGSAVGCELMVFDISSSTNPIYVAGRDSDSSLSGRSVVAVQASWVSGDTLVIGKASDTITCEQDPGLRTGCEIALYKLPTTIQGVLTGSNGLATLSANGFTRVIDAASTTNILAAASSQFTAPSTTLSVSGQLQLGGSFVHNFGSVILNGTDQSIITTATTTFNNVIKQATTSATTTFSTTGGFVTTGTLNLQGTAFAKMALRSTTPGVQFNLMPQGPVSMSYLDVRDARNSSSTFIDCTSFCTDGGNNTNWDFSSEESVWNASDWTLFDTITIQEENIDSDLVDFPVYVNLDDLSSTFWSTTPGSASLVGTDIRVTTASNVEVPRELVFASSTAGTGELHFKAPTISSATDTVFKIWYNGTTTGDYDDNATYGAENVWSNDYLGVYHLDDNPALGAGAIIDSTNFARHGTSSGSVTSADEVTGKLGNSLDFDGDDFVQINGLFGQPVRGTLSTWLELDSTSAGSELISLGDSFALRAGSGNDTKGFYHQTGQWNDTIAGQQPNAPYSWKYLAFVNNPSASSQVIFTNGVADGSGSFSAAILYDQGASTFLGSHGNGDGNFNLNGRLDEVRIASTSRSTAWVKAEYYNQSTSTDFYAVDVEGAVGSSTIANHDAGQVSNTFNNSNKVNESLYAFKLTPNAGTSTVTSLVLSASGVSGLVSGDFTNIRLVRDLDNDAQYDASDVAVGGTGSMSISGQSGTITFAEDFLSTTSQNYLVVADWNAPGNGSFITIQLLSQNITMVSAGTDSVPVVSGTTGSPTVTSDVSYQGMTGTTYRWGTSGGTIDFSTAGTVYPLIVAGGGAGGNGGGYERGGGGGAGGMVGGYPAHPDYSFGATVSSYAITVGLGGVPSTTLPGPGTNGGNSSIVGTNAPAVAIGGGGGGSQNNGASGNNGGSGGGATFDQTAGSGTANQGNAGSLALISTNGGGGGGGAGQPGQTQTASDQALAGGDGLQSSITGSAVYYAGGAGGTMDNDARNGASGGLGGGGSASGLTYTARSGTDGLGGGGAPGQTSTVDGYRTGKGGDGTVILFVPNAVAPVVQAVFGSVNSIQHGRNNKSGGGRAAAIGGDAPEGAGNVGGGGNTGGEVIGNDPDYFWPSSHSGSWTNGASAYDQTDGTYATTNSGANHQYADHSLVVPGSNTIQGIIIKLELSGTTGAGTVDVQLSWDGGSSWTSAKSTPTLSTTDAVYTLGSPSDLWGRSWSTSDFSNANFRIRVIGNVSSNTIRLDAVQVRVYHTAGGGGGGGGGAI